MAIFRWILAPIAALLLTVDCGGGGGGSSPATLQPPAGLTYGQITEICTEGVAISPNDPSSTGGAVSSYSVSPALPSGLSLGSASGVISGIPTAPAAAATYVVTAANSAGSTSASLSITVNAPLAAPANLAYTLSTAVYTQGVAITPNNPTCTGGAVSSYSVSPALPAGLALGSASGVISGTPTAAAAAATYVVTAANSAGSTSASLGITVTAALTAPASLTYTLSTAVYSQGVAITPNNPTSTGGAVSSYSVSPALPAGLALSSTSGVISGTPTVAAAAATYVVTAANPAGTATASLGITVTASLIAPANLTYTLSTAVYTQGVAITPNRPTSTGGAVSSYSVSPALPAGLSLDSTSGVISGSPTTVTAASVYTVQAANAAGNTTAALTITVKQPATAGLAEGWEDGWDNWYADNGLWAVGSPSNPNGPSAAYDGKNCASSGLVQNDSLGQVSNLISPAFTVPAAAQNPRLQFWHWFVFSGNGSYVPGEGRVSVRIVGQTTWTALSNYYTGNSEIWTPVILDLSAYAGQDIQIGFNVNTGTVTYAVGQTVGWFIDDISVQTGSDALATLEGWENGWENWSADNGLWAVGAPSNPNGPAAAYDGKNCVSSGLIQNDSLGQSSNLLSPPITVPAAGQNPRLRFWHWFNLAGNGSYVPGEGKVAVRIVGQANWTTISNLYTGFSEIWSPVVLDLSAFAGQAIQIGFNLNTGTVAYAVGQTVGWFIDDISIETGPDAFSAAEGWENGWDGWSADNGLWAVGIPTNPNGPSAPSGGNNCVSTGLVQNDSLGQVSNLVSPPITVPAAGQDPRLQFWHWFVFSGNGSYTPGEGKVQVRIVGQTTWTAISNYYTGNSEIWTPVILDLSAYAGQKIQIGFNANTGTVAYAVGQTVGWFIDDISVLTN